MSGIWLGSYVVLWALLLVVVLTQIGVLRHIGILYGLSSRGSTVLSTVRVGKVLPNIPLRALTGRQVQSRDLAGRCTELIVISPNCSGCVGLLQSLVQQEYEPKVWESRTIISLGDAESTSALTQALGVPGECVVLVDPQANVKEEWGVRGTPLTLQVDESLRVVGQRLGGHAVLMDAESAKSGVPQHSDNRHSLVS